MKNLFTEPKKKKLVVIVAVLILLVVVYFTFKALTARGAVFSFIQTDWSGGADITGSVDHISNLSNPAGWLKFFSKSDNVKTDVGGQISLISTTSSFVSTSDADFNAGTKTNVYTNSGTVVMQKPLDVACLANGECSSGWCRNSSFCAVCDPITYDGTVYQVEVVGDKCWLKTPLKVGTMISSVNQGSSHTEASNNGIIEKFCYNNVCDNTYGGLYDWNEAMGYATTSGAVGICPTGWHIPSDAEWSAYENILKTSTCNSSRVAAWDCDPVGTLLKVGPLFGERAAVGNFTNLNYSQSFWTSTENGGGAWARGVQSDKTQTYRQTVDKNFGYAVKCLKD
jgi:uncharacterized protein (TIGR02145 family)